jgi:two-component system cell cycle response regulator DivK
MIAAASTGLNLAEPYHSVGSPKGVECPSAVTGGDHESGDRMIAAVAAERTATATRILIVDDDPTIRSVLEALLEDEGFQPVTAANGREALSIVGVTPPALILMDLMMPVMSGIDAVRELKSDPDTSGIPIIAMSAGFILRESIDELLADSIISKPFDLDALIANIRATLRRVSGETPELHP